MKKLLGFLLCMLLVVLCASALASDPVQINAANFPDDSFRAYVSEKTSLSLFLPYRSRTSQIKMR